VQVQYPSNVVGTPIELSRFVAQDGLLYSVVQISFYGRSLSLVVPSSIYILLQTWVKQCNRSCPTLKFSLAVFHVELDVL
jgi:hypothetical protein